MSGELKKCPFLVHEDWCDDFDGPCAVSKGSRCEVFEQITERDARIAALEDTVLKLTGKKRFRGDETMLYAAHKETLAYRDKRIVELEAERDRLREALKEIAKIDRVCFNYAWTLDDGYCCKSGDFISDDDTKICTHFKMKRIPDHCRIAQKALEGAGE